MKQADIFSEHVSSIEHAIKHHDISGMKAVIECTSLLADLYSLGLKLPSAASEEVESKEPEEISEKEYAQVSAYASRLPFQYYNEVLEPLELESQECGVGDIADDIRDIYSDVVSTNRIFENGNRASAIWHWNFTMRTHWGRHATSAIHVLQCYSAGKLAEWVSQQNA